MNELAGEIALVTGGTKGIGQAIAEKLAAAGARVVVTSRDGQTAQRVAAALGSVHLGLAMDVSSTDAVDRVAARLADEGSSPTILVNNAGINRIGSAESFEDEDWAAVIDVNLGGTYRCCRAFGRLMLGAGRGTIVNVSSMSARTGLPGRAPYAASKAGIVGLTHTLAVEWAGRGVRVNAVLPGPVRTPMVEDAIAAGILQPQEIEERTPAGRLGLPEDVAGAVFLLCLPEAGFITGQALAVDGGYSVYGAAHDASLVVERVARA
jgi:3-oxoacyl-[acyl-carrier protein] reductase